MWCYITIHDHLLDQICYFFLFPAIQKNYKAHIVVLSVRWVVHDNPMPGRGEKWEYVLSKEVWGACGRSSTGGFSPSYGFTFGT